MNEKNEWLSLLIDIARGITLGTIAYSNQRQALLNKLAREKVQTDFDSIKNMLDEMAEIVHGNGNSE